LYGGVLVSVGLMFIVKVQDAPTVAAVGQDVTEELTSREFPSIHAPVVEVDPLTCNWELPSLSGRLVVVFTNPVPIMT
jgi:hypothetical protein